MDEMLVHGRIIPIIEFTSTYLYPLVERDTVRVLRI